jgi:hypothetical protein
MVISDLAKLPAETKLWRTSREWRDARRDARQAVAR